MKAFPCIKHFNVALFLTAFLSLCTIAQQASAIEWNGYIQTDNRFLSRSPYDYSWQEHRLSLRGAAVPNEKSHFYGEAWILYNNCPRLETSADLSSREELSPWAIDVREAYVDLYGFLHENIDLRIGKQRIAWGTADNLNPTDNLNPDDLEDIWDFGRHMGSLAANASFYWWDTKIQAVYIPSFIPALLPSGNWSTILMKEIPLPQDLTLRNISDRIIMPQRNLEEASAGGLKIQRRLLNFDLSLSYVYGRDDLPIAHRVTLIATTNPPEVDIETELSYPRMSILGFDLAGAMLDIGIWAEMAVFMPEEVMLTTDLSQLGMGTQQSVSLDDSPYTKFILGTDYTFKNGIYLNAQYLHGFIHERGRENLGDYLMFGIELKRSDGKFILKPLQGGLEITDFRNVGDNYAYILSPEIVYKPVDGSELTLGYRLIEGTEATTFGKMKDYDEVFLKAKYSF